MMVSVDWSSALDELRDLLGTEEDVNNTRQRLLLQHTFALVHKQLLAYCTQLNNSNSNNNKDELKQLVLETKRALKFAMACLSMFTTESDTDAVLRTTVQNQAVLAPAHGWQGPLARIIAHPGEGDEKCRLTAARLLSNLLTSNAESCATVVGQIPLAPTRQEIANRIRDSLSSELDVIGDDANDGANDGDDSLACTTLEKMNWTDLLIRTARFAGRDTLAALVAALHNCASSLEGSGQEELSSGFVHELASTRLLICTLLRQLVSIQTVNESLKEGAAAADDEQQTDDCRDAATEWISILVLKLCRVGQLSTVYQSAGGDEASCRGAVFPEQTVLLYCLREEVDAAGEGTSSPLGESDEIFTASCLFLVDEYFKIRTAVTTCTGNDVDDMTKDLAKSALSTILDILAEALSVDTQSAASARLCLGRDTTFLQHVGLELGTVVDNLSVVNSGRKVRDMTMMDEQRQTITILVRTLGNLCFACRQNQDLLRTTLVPPAATIKATAASERSALHVLLSCTSFSHSCFTLREWAVVAIRNALDGNNENQTEVERLEGQQPVQSAELNDMGIRVDLNHKGNVSVVPLDGIPESKGETNGGASK